MKTIFARTKTDPVDEESYKDLGEPIAIVGMSGILPQSADLNEFWENIRNEKDLITLVPEQRWDWRKYFGDPSTEANKTNSKWGGFIDDIDKFDADFFGISNREANLMDPQQRLVLEMSWKAIEDAGYNPYDLAGTSTGVFLGAATKDYYELLKDHGVPIEAHTSTGTQHSVLANRVSYLLDIHGPSEVIDTACSSSLIAIQRAVQSIYSGDCTQALAGA